jgi:hypothetical protein
MPFLPIDYKRWGVEGETAIKIRIQVKTKAKGIFFSNAMGYRPVTVW